MGESLLSAAINQAWCRLEGWGYPAPGARNVFPSRVEGMPPSLAIVPPGERGAIDCTSATAWCALQAIPRLRTRAAWAALQIASRPVDPWEAIRYLVDHELGVEVPLRKPGEYLVQTWSRLDANGRFVTARSLGPSYGHCRSVRVLDRRRLLVRESTSRRHPEGGPGVLVRELPISVVATWGDTTRAGRLHEDLVP